VSATVQSVERAAAMLRLLADEDEPIGLAKIASALGLAKGTAHGLLRTLQDVGFIEQTFPTGP
jgi:DNA-binding IclR family transcriptional regulator